MTQYLLSTFAVEDEVEGTQALPRKCRSHRLWRAAAEPRPVDGPSIIIAHDLDDELGWARKVIEAIKSREISSAMSSSIS